MAILDALEQDLQRPVISANGVPVELLARGGRAKPVIGYGNLLGRR